MIVCGVGAVLALLTTAIVVGIIRGDPARRQPDTRPSGAAPVAMTPTPTPAPSLDLPLVPWDGGPAY